jgi:hypothetical protein
MCFFIGQLTERALSEVFSNKPKKYRRWTKKWTKRSVVRLNLTASFVVNRRLIQPRGSLLGHFLDTFTVPVATDVTHHPGGLPPPRIGSDTKSGALSILRLCRSVSTEGQCPPVTVYPAALKSSANSSSIWTAASKGIGFKCS